MLKKKKIFAVLLTLVFTMAVSVTSLAATTLISEYNKPITKTTPYVSATFTPKTNLINLRYGLNDSTAQYNSTYNLQAFSGGSWFTVESGVLGGASTISTSYNVTVGTTYRIRVTTTDPYSRHLFCIVEDAGN